MAMFLLGNEFMPEQQRRNFGYYDPISTGDSSRSASIQCIVASEIGEEVAACEFLDDAVWVDLATRCRTAGGRCPAGTARR